MDDLTQELLVLLATMRAYGPGEAAMRLRALAAVSQQMDTPSLLRLVEQQIGCPRTDYPAAALRDAPEPASPAVTLRASRI